MFVEEKLQNISNNYHMVFFGSARKTNSQCKNVSAGTHNCKIVIIRRFLKDEICFLPKLSARILPSKIQSTALG